MRSKGCRGKPSATTSRQRRCRSEHTGAETPSSRATQMDGCRTAAHLRARKEGVCQQAGRLAQQEHLQHRAGVSMEGGWHAA